jgi:1-acyl-sn-glycerol-3-phosphate acyltransferase
VLPPRIVRRLIIAPLAVLVTIALVVVSPLLALLALIAAPSRPARRRSLRLLRFGLTWLVMESAALFASLGLWLASGFGGRLGSEESLERHYTLIRWFLDTLFEQAIRVFQLHVEVDEPVATPAELAARLTRPVIVLSRHAGPGDSFLLVHQLLSRYGRRPRIVMKAALQFDPSIDVVINRLPHAFVHPRPAPVLVPEPRGSSEALDPAAEPSREPAAEPSLEPALEPSPEPAPELSPEPAPEPAPELEAAATPVDGVVIEEIRRLGAGLGPTGALVIFPEGGNFTPARRRRGIRRLWESRRYALARRAAGLRNLLPPRSGGVFAAIDAAPEADVIFVAHTGLDDLVTVGDIWRALPMEQVIRAQWWRVPAAEVPRERDEVVRWLYDWWERIDAWIAENRPVRPI